MSLVKILIIGGNDSESMEIQNKLELCGYSPIRALCKEEIIEKAYKIKPDVILMDILLKGGIDTIEAVKKVIDNFDTSIVYIIPDERALYYVENMKSYSFVSKPFEPNQLKFTIEKTLYRRKIVQRFKSNSKLYVNEALFAANK